ncbi:MAG TPA: glycosyltransferase family 4 protein [Candidatus Saccharimonadales bacterium]|nr:glycosyltransferase family 4 protein [Candidatus Saccharimonadales bacterium]
MKFIIVPNAPVMAARHFCIAKTLIEQGHEVHYMMWALPYNIKPSEMLKHLFTSLRSKTYVHEGITVHTARRLPYFWPFINGWIFKSQIRRLFKRLNADIIFTESFTNETEVPKDLPFIYDLADDYAAPADVYGSPIYKLAFKLLGIRNVMKRQCRNAIAVTAVSDILYNFAKQYNSNVHMLRNGLDKGIIEMTLRDLPTRPTNKHSMVYVTRFGQWSRAIETLEATVKLKKEFPDLELHLVGEGTESAKMLAFIKEHNAEGYIHYHGFIYDRKKMYELMGQSQIGLNISDKNKWRDAAHPIKVIEYSAFGIKVVSTNLAEVEALALPNIFTFSDEPKGTSLIDAMRRALQSENEPSSFEAVSKEVLKVYDWHRIVYALETVINDALKRRSSSD